IGYQGSTFTNANTINGNGGDDWVMADAGNTLIPDRNTTNGAIGTALALDSSSLWTTDENPTIGNTFVPHATAIVEATIGQAEYFSVTVGAGHTLTVDIDYGQSGPIGPSEDLIVEILNGAGTILATFDDSLITDGGLGSYAYNSLGNSRDPYGAYVAPAAGLLHPGPALWRRTVRDVQPEFDVRAERQRLRSFDHLELGHGIRHHQRW